MKILHVQVLPKLSGVQRVSLEIFKSLPPEYDKTVMFSNETDCGSFDECVREFEATGAKVIFSDNLKREISPLCDFRAMKEIYRLCRKEGFDIVHTNSTKPGIVGRIAARCARVPKVVHTVHGLAFHRFIRFPRWQFYWACEMAASVFSHKITIVNRYYQKHFKWFRKKTSTIYNGLDFSKFPQLELRRSTDKKVRILFVGRLDMQKNPMMLLRVARKVCDVYPETVFTFVGDGEYMQQCRDFVAENKLDTNVELVGWSDNPAQYYASHDIFAMTSIYEAFGLIFLEAGFYELPSVATTVEGIPEVVADGVTGFLSEPNDEDSFVRNIVTLIENPEMRKKMGVAAKKRVTEKFSAGKMVEQYISLYQAK